MENNIWTVYEHISPSGKSYIGITSNIKSRWANRGYYYCTYNSAFKRAIEKYGWDSMEHNVVVSNVGFLTACNVEKDLITFNKKRNASYNITDGGQGTLGRVMSSESRDKNRKSHIGIKMTQEQRKNISEAHLNSKASREASKRTIKIAQKAWRGNHHSEETKKRMSEKAKGRDMTKAILASKAKAHDYAPKKAVVQYSLSGTVIKNYDSIKQASEETGILRSAISNCLKGKTLSSGGYKWEYKRKEDDDEQQ